MEPNHVERWQVRDQGSRQVPGEALRDRYGVVPPGFTPCVDVCTTLGEMYDGLKKLVETSKPVRTMSALFDRYLLERVPALAPRTQSDYRKYIQRLRPVLNDWEPQEVTSGDVFDIRAKVAQD